MLREFYHLPLPFASAEWPMLVKVNLLITLFFLITAFMLFLFILFSRLRDGIKYAQKRWMEKKAQEFITPYLFNLFSEEWSKIRIKNFRRKYLSNKFQRDIFLESMVKLHKNIAGETSESLRSLYVELDLSEHSRRKLNSASWQKIAKGICELAEMGTKQDKEFIRSFINHQNPILRSEAQVALLKLESEAPFSFLDELEEPLSEWQQMQLARAAQKAKLSTLPDFERWLHKKEESIVIFCIRMIAQYGQHKASQKILGLLKHPYPPARVRKEIIIAIRQLVLYEAADKLRRLYVYETTEIQLEILKALAVIAGNNAVSNEDVLPGNDKLFQLVPANMETFSGKQQEEKIAAL